MNKKLFTMTLASIVFSQVTVFGQAKVREPLDLKKARAAVKLDEGNKADQLVIIKQYINNLSQRLYLL